MRETAAVVLAFGAVVSYFVLATRFAVYQRWPWIHLLLAVVACVILVVSVAKRSGWGRLFAVLAAVVTAGLTGLFFWYTLAFSTYPSSQTAVAVGDRLGPEVTRLQLPSHSGEARAVVRPGEDRGTLLVFYRGYW